MKHIVVLIVFVFIISISGCSGPLGDIFDCSCDDQIEDVVAALGQPEEVDKYNASGGYHSWTYWYWCKGISYTFTWGGGAGCCEWSTYQFSPICSY